jgi:hypothetical protein
VPGSSLERITRLACREVSQLYHDDGDVVILGGANDINTNESKLVSKHMRKFALQNKHTSVIVKWKEVPTVASIDEPMMDSISENAVRTLSRPKRTPVTRNEDFLWSMNSPKTV